MSLFAETPRPESRRMTREPVVPMINVVFLLLVFFLMTAQIAPPEPFELTLPKAQGEEAQGRDILFVSATGEIAFNDLREDAAIAAAAQADPLRLHVDEALDATELARLLARLAERGARNLRLVAEGG